MEFLAWPAAVVIIALSFFGIFRKQVGGFLNRAERITKDGLIARAEAQQQLLAGDADRDTGTHVLDLFRGEVLAEQEASIRKDIKEKGMEGKPDLERVLVRALAATQIALEFEKIHSLIWDSQLTLLRLLARTPLRMSAIRENYPPNKFLNRVPFEEWMAYLTGNNVVSVSGSGETADAEITPFGREYLKYLIDAGRPDRGIG